LNFNCRLSVFITTPSAISQQSNIHYFVNELIAYATAVQYADDGYSRDVACSPYGLNDCIPRMTPTSVVQEMVSLKG